MGISHDATAGLHVSAAFTEKCGPNRNGHIHVAGKVQVANHSTVDSAPVGFEFVKEPQRPGLGRSGQRTGREGRFQDVVGLGMGGASSPTTVDTRCMM